MVDTKQEAHFARIEELFRSGVLHTPGGDEVAIRSSVTAEEAKLLYRVVRKIKTRYSLEVGMGQGVSTLSIVQALEDNERGHHYVFDPMESSFDDVGPETIRRAGLGHRMTFYREYFEGKYAELPSVKFAFIDASHLFDLTIMAFALVDRRLGLGGIVGFHDTRLPSQQKVIRYILNNRDYEIYRPEGGAARRVGKMKRMLGRVLRPELALPWKSFGLPELALLKKLGHDERNWDFHEPF